MKKKSVKYLLHFMLLCMPLLLLLIACIFPTKQINNTYALEETTTTETETTINFNQIISNEQILNEYNRYLTISYGPTHYFYFNKIENHTYYISTFARLENDNSNLFQLGFGDNVYETKVHFINLTTNYLKYSAVLKADYTYNNSFFFIRSGSFTDNNNILYSQYFNVYDLTEMGLDTLSLEDINKLFQLDYYAYNNGQEITLNTLTKVNNVGNDAQAPLQSNETKQPNEAILMPYKTFYSLSVNNWYRSLLNLIGVDISSTDFVQGYLLYFPLWAMWFWLFELIELAVTLVPKLVYDIYTKLSRSKDE